MEVTQNFNLEDFITETRENLRQNFFTFIDPDIQIYMHRLLQLPWLATTASCQGKLDRRFGHTNDTYSIGHTYFLMYFSIAVDNLGSMLGRIAEWHKQFGVGAYEFKLDYTPKGWRLNVACSPDIRDQFLDKFCVEAEEIEWKK